MARPIVTFALFLPLLTFFWIEKPGPPTQTPHKPAPGDTAPADEIFSDGFESGDTSRWSLEYGNCQNLFGGFWWQGHCYVWLQGSGDWFNSETTCEAWAPGGELVSVESAEERDFLLDSVVPPSSDAWIGLSRGTDGSCPGTWEWQSQEPVVFTDWETGNPDDGACPACAAAWSALEHRWDDLTCSSGVVQDALCETNLRNLRVAKPEGGALEFPNGVVLDLLPGAVDFPTPLSVEVEPCSLVDEIVAEQDGEFFTHYKRCLGAYSGYPDGLTFNAPVQGQFPVTSLLPWEFPALIEVDTDQRLYRPINTNMMYSSSDGYASFEILHFSEVDVPVALEEFGDEWAEQGNSCTTCDGWNQQPGVCEGVFVDPLQPACCAVNAPERRDCFLGTCEDCCREGRIHVVASDVDFSLNECNLAGADYTITYLDCPGQPQESDSMKGDTPECDDVDWELQISAPGELKVCDEATMEATMHGEDNEGNIFDIIFYEENCEPGQVCEGPNWESNEPDTVQFEPEHSRNLRALEPGTAQVQASLGTVESEWLDVQVQDRYIVIEPTPHPLVRGEFWQPDTVSLDETCGPSPWCEVEWASADASVFEIGQDGLGWAVPQSWGAGIAAMETTVTATLDSSEYFPDWCTAEIQGHVDIRVVREVSSIEVTPSESTITIGETLQLTPIVTDDLGDTWEGFLGLDWFSNNLDVATVDSSGLVTAVAPGDAAITASTGEVFGVATVSVEVETYRVSWGVGIGTPLSYSDIYACGFANCDIDPNCPAEYGTNRTWWGWIQGGFDVWILPDGQPELRPYGSLGGGSLHKNDWLWWSYGCTEESNEIWDWSSHPAEGDPPCQELILGDPVDWIAVAFAADELTLSIDFSRCDMHFTYFYDFLGPWCEGEPPRDTGTEIVDSILGEFPQLQGVELRVALADGATDQKRTATSKLSQCCDPYTPGGSCEPSYPVYADFEITVARQP